MKETTQSFLSKVDSGKSVRTAITNQLMESRFYGYGEMVKNNPGVLAVVKKGSEKEVAEYLKQHEEELNIPVRLTDSGRRRMAQLLVLIGMNKEG